MKALTFEVKPPYFHIFTTDVHRLYLVYLYYISQWQLITPSNGQKHFKTAENDQFSKTLAGYKWSQKVAIFSEVKEKG